MHKRPTLNWLVGPSADTLNALWPGLTIEVLADIDSTNTELMRRARAGHTQPTLLVAEQQSAGRGRLGRNWKSGAGQPGDALTFSLALPLAPADWSGLSLAVGLAVAESLHPGIGLKWPNDLWLQDRKLAGILIETAAALGRASGVRQVVIGVGINIAPLTAQGLNTPPAWLRELLPEIDAPGALGRIAAPLLSAVQAFALAGFAPLVPRYAARDVLAGRRVCLSHGGEGVARGVAANGALRVHTDEGWQEVSSAEVSVRPQAPLPRHTGET